MFLENGEKREIAFCGILLALCAFHILASVYKMPNIFENEPSAGVFGGIRLHYLKFWNFDFSKGIPALGGTSHLLDNFIKSFVYGQHGMLDYLHWYIYVGVYDFLGIPLTEFWLLVAQTVVMILALLIICLLIKEIYENRLAAVVFLIIASQIYINYSRSFYIVPANALMEGLLLYALYYYNCKNDGFLAGSALMILIFVNSASGNIIKLPLFLLFIWCVNYKVNGLNLFKTLREYLIKKPLNIIFVVPALVASLCHFYVYRRIGISNLGLIGWISQKVGLGAPIFSKFVLIKQAFEKLVFTGAIHWRAVSIILVFYALGIIRDKRRTPLFLFPLVYYLYLINLEPNSALLAHVILISIGISEMFFIVKGIAGLRVIKFSSYAFISIFTVYTLGHFTFENINSFVKRPTPSPNYLKSVGFFLRENMTNDDKIASLLDQTENILNEYYYGKTFFKSPVFGKEIYDYRNLTQPLSSGNPVSPEEVDREFPFYVVSSEFYKKDRAYSKFVDALVKEYSLRKIADVANGNVIYASIYSSRPIKYIRLDIEEANKKFNQKYANLDNLFYHHHVGVASTWGYY